MIQLSDAALELYPLASFYLGLGDVASIVTNGIFIVTGLSVFFSVLNLVAGRIVRASLIVSAVLLFPAYAAGQALTDYRSAQLYDAAGLSLGTVSGVLVTAGGCASSRTHVQLAGVKDRIAVAGALEVNPGDRLELKHAPHGEFACVAGTGRCARIL